MPETVQGLIEQYVSEIKKIYGTHLRQIILYGSYARGDYGPDSDIDIMILLDIRGAFYAETLLGVTDSGKTFTLANVIEQLNKPTLVIAHNKTLAGQLYSEFKKYFPDNAVEYFVS